MHITNLRFLPAQKHPWHGHDKSQIPPSTETKWCTHSWYSLHTCCRYCRLLDFPKQQNQPDMHISQTSDLSRHRNIHDMDMTNLRFLPAQKQSDVHIPDTHYIHAVDIVDFSIFPTSQMCDISVHCDLRGIEDRWLIHVVPYKQVKGWSHILWQSKLVCPPLAYMFLYKVRPARGTCQK